MIRRFFIAGAIALLIPSSPYSLAKTTHKPAQKIGAETSEQVDAVFNCVSTASAFIGWNIKKTKLDGEVQLTDEEPVRVTFVTLRKGGFLKGNLGQIELVKISDRSYIELNTRAHAILWSLFPGSQKVPTILIQQKTYALPGIDSPDSYTNIYLCD